MCFNQRWIRNRYTLQRFFVSCGHCPACLQEKAHKRMSRIYNELSPQYLHLFVTLTYDRDSCPYIKVSDVDNKLSTLNIYRDVKIQRTFGSSRVVHELDVLGKIDLVDYSSFMDMKSSKLRPLAFRSHNIGIAWYKDKQLFEKRLKQNLIRLFNYHGYYKSFCCSEYGESTCRPHFHFVMQVEKNALEIFKSAILASWPFSSRNRLLRGIEIARDVASYVASYFNSPADFPIFLADNFPPKHSFSKDFGFNLDSFLLDSILQKVECGDMSYYKQFVRDGYTEVLNIPIPKYVVNRFFPQFKGYSRLPCAEVYDVLSHPARLRRYAKELDYTEEDLISIPRRLFNKYTQWFLPMGYSIDDYIALYIKAWNCYRSSVYKHFVTNGDVPLLEKYDNLYEIDNGSVRASFDLPPYTLLNPNEFPSNIASTNKLIQQFNKKVKCKKVSDIVQSKINAL